MNALEVIQQKYTSNDVIKLLNTLGFTNVNTYGNQLRAKCHIHGGHNPSAFCFSVEKNVWYCQSCHASGDIAQLIEDTLKLSYSESVEYALAFIGIESMEGLELIKRTDKYIKDLQDFMAYAKKTKKKSVASYELPKADYKQVKSFRNFKEDTLAYFNMCLVNDFPFEKKDGTIMTINNRLGMPIRFYGETVGYALRKIKAEDNPKWLFQPNGLDKKNLINYLEKKWYDEIILCEGHFDVWAYYVAGITHVGCVLGSSVTKEQEELLLKHTLRLVLSFDGDRAGIDATLKTIEQLKNKFDVYVVVFPEGQDPCSISTEALIECYKNKMHYNRFLLNYK